MGLSMVTAIVSALAMGGVYLVDKAMVGNTYSKPSQAMLISSIASFLPAPILFLIPEWDTPPPEAIAISLIGGMVLMLCNWLYFLVVYTDAGEITEIACYENSSVIVIVLITGLLSVLGMYHDSINSWQLVGVGLGLLGLFGLALWGEQLELVTAKHRLMLIGFMVLGASFEMLLDYSMHLAKKSPTIQTDLQAYLSVSPFFWFGLATGVLTVLPKEEREALREKWSDILANWRWIALAECFALIAFGAMLYSFTAEHVAVVGMVAGSFPIVVFIGGIILRRRYGFPEKVFPVVKHPIGKTVAILCIIAGAIIAIA